MHPPCVYRMGLARERALVSRIFLPRDMVLDPFCGSGLTPLHLSQPRNLCVRFVIPCYVVISVNQSQYNGSPRFAKERLWLLAFTLPVRTRKAMLR